MKIIIVVLCLLAAVAAIPVQQQQLKRFIREVSEIAKEPEHDYLPPTPVATEPKSNYLPPIEPMEQTEPVAEEVAEPSVDTREVNTAEEAETVEAAFEAVPETAALGENGYEYRTIRRHRLRQRRDVSHLKLGYLPPVEKPRIAPTYLPPPPQLDVPQAVPQLKLSNEYLPPLKEYLPPKESTTDAIATEAPTTEVFTTEASTTEAPTTAAPTTEAPTVPQAVPQLKVSNEYLPPLKEYLPPKESTTEAIATEAPTTEVSTTEASTTLIPTTVAPTTAAPTTAAVNTKEAAPVESAVFAEDGYHYRKPAVLPDLGFSPLTKVAEPDVALEAPESQPEAVQVVEVAAVIESEKQPTAVEQDPEFEPVIVAELELAYLPPLEEGVVVAEGPGQETAALLDDGYHYRVVKRVRLF